MSDLLETYNQLNEAHRRQLLAYADLLLTQQKVKKSEADLTEWKQNIKKVSVWTEEDIAGFDENAKNLNQWKIPEW